MMFGDRCQFDYDEETIEPKTEKANKKRKSNAMLLKAFLAKWQWDSLKNADEVLTQSEQKVWGLMEENERLKAKVEAECQEHQEAMRVADKTIKVLEKALTLACDELPSPIVFWGNYMETTDDWCKYFKTTARKELE